MGLARVVGAGVIAAAAVVFAAGGAGAEPVTSVESGWWNLAAPATPSGAPGVAGVPQPPSVTPSDQLQVSNGPNGVLAFAAVRFTLPATLNSQPLDPSTARVTLTLPIVANSTVGTPAISACPASGSWSAGPDQPSTSAPTYDCSAGKEATGTVTSSSESWSLTAVAADPSDPSTFSVALVPAPGSNLPFSIQYSAPVPASVTVESGGSAGGTATTTPDSGVPAGPTDTGGVSTTGGPGSASAGGGSSPASLGLGSSFNGSAAALPVGDQGAPVPNLGSLGSGAAGSGTGGGNSVATGQGQQAAPLLAAAKPDGLSTRARRVLALLVLLAIGGGLFYVGNRPETAPRLLGSLGGRTAGAGVGPAASGVGTSVAASSVPVARTGGIGRFARPRTGPPRRL